MLVKHRYQRQLKRQMDKLKTYSPYILTLVASCTIHTIAVGIPLWSLLLLPAVMFITLFVTYIIRCKVVIYKHTVLDYKALAKFTSGFAVIGFIMAILIVIHTYVRLPRIASVMLGWPMVPIVGAVLISIYTFTIDHKYLDEFCHD